MFDDNERHQYTVHMKNKTNKASKASINKNNMLSGRYKKPLLIASGVVVSLFLIGQIVFDMYVYQMANYAGSDRIAQLIISAVEGLKVPVPVDAETGKMYIAGAKLVWPAQSSVFGQVIYTPYDSEWVGDTGMQFTTSAIMSAATSKLLSFQSGRSYPNAVFEDIFKQVPNLQACAARGVQVFYHKNQNFDQSGYVYHGSVSLKDGRELHFYTESTCKQDQTALVEYLKKAESY